MLHHRDGVVLYDVEFGEYKVVQLYVVADIQTP